MLVGELLTVTYMDVTTGFHLTCLAVTHEDTCFARMIVTQLYPQCASRKVDYKAPLPCLTVAVVDITIDRVEGRKLFVTGRLKSLDGKVHYSSAEALFIKPKARPPSGKEELNAE